MVSIMAPGVVPDPYSMVEEGSGTGCGAGRGTQDLTHGNDPTSFMQAGASCIFSQGRHAADSRYSGWMQTLMRAQAWTNLLSGNSSLPPKPPDNTPEYNTVYGRERSNLTWGQHAGGGAVADPAKAGKLLTEVAAVRQEADLSGLQVVAADEAFLADTDRQIHSQAQVCYLLPEMHCQVRRGDSRRNQRSKSTTLLAANACRQGLLGRDRPPEPQPSSGQSRRIVPEHT